jgi:hypothetical protein
LTASEDAQDRNESRSTLKHGLAGFIALSGIVVEGDGSVAFTPDIAEGPL